jgi:hypothetical protein
VVVLKKGGRVLGELAVAAVDGRVIGAVVKGDWVVPKVCKGSAGEGVGVRVEATRFSVAAVGGVGVDVMVGTLKTGAGGCCGCVCVCC